MFRSPLDSGRCWSVAVVALCLILPSSAGATVYELGDSGWTAVVDQGNINVITQVTTGAAVVIRIEKTFEGQPDPLGLMPPLYLDFYKTGENAAGQIIINDESITNDTSVDWIDFHMALEVSVSNPEAGFSTTLLPSGDLFSTVVLSGSNGYNGMATKLDFSDGLVPNDSPGNVFEPGADSGGIVIVANPAMAVNPDMVIDEKIRLKEYPTIPEPATLTMLFIGSGLVMLKRRATP